MTRKLLLALVVMFFQQSLATAAKSVVALIAPAAIADLGVPAAYTGIYVGLAAFVQVFVMLGCGGIIRRHGGVRTSQIGLLLITIGVAFASSGVLWPFLLAALFIPFGTSVSTPASSQVLAPYVKPKIAPLIFSAKQTAVPFGLTVAGVLVPVLVHQFGWQGALLAFGAMCAAYAVLLQPTRAELDRGRDPGQRFSLGDVKSTFVRIVAAPAFRRLGLAACAYVGLQTTFLTFFVLFLTQGLGYSLAAAGGLFAAATAASVPMRIVWGFVAGNWLSPGAVLMAMGAFMAIATILVGWIGADWTTWQILGVAFLVASTALSWQGVLLSEIVRLTPTPEVGTVTGGVLAISAVGQMLMPLMFSAILAVTGSYAFGFYAAALPPLLVVLMLLAVRGDESDGPR